MLEALKYTVVFTVAARRDISQILSRSVTEFGASAALRYEALISEAVRDLRVDPDRPGSTTHPEIENPKARLYHLSFSRNRVAGIKVKSPRHFILYRSAAPGLIEIGRVLDESRDLGRHLPKEYRRADDDDDESAE